MKIDSISMLNGGLERRLIAFVDALGWRFEVDSGNLTKVAVLLSTLEPFSSGYLKYNEENEADLQYTLFSDTIVFSERLDDQPNLPERLKIMFSQIDGIYQSGLTMGWLLRGGISTGELFHRGSICVGPALHSAYDMESKIANFPRLLLDDESIEVLESSMGWVTLAARSRSNPVFCGQPIFNDTDG